MSTRPNGYFNVYIRAIRDGRWDGPEVAVTADHQYPNNRLYFGPWDMHITPVWMPTGDELLLVSNRDVPLGSGNVLRVPAEQNGIERAQTVLAEQTLYRTQPDVSIDGKRFVYSSTSGTADQFSNLYVQPTTGGEPYKMTFFSHDAFDPRWSPDGTKILFVGRQDTETPPDIWTLDLESGDRQNTLGVAHYRASEWNAAIEALNKSEELWAGKCFSFNGFFLAMAHWQLDHADDARDWYHRAVDWMEKERPDNEELQRFRAESAELLGVPTVAPKPEQRIVSPDRGGSQ